MESATLTTITTLKKELALVIEKNNYNLLSLEVITLSQSLDQLITPLFKYQLELSSLL